VAGEWQVGVGEWQVSGRWEQASGWLMVRSFGVPLTLTGELQPLPILKGHWDMTSIDFIIELPESRGYDTVMVVLDSAGKCAHFIETITTVMAAGTANLYLHNVWKLHGLPQQMILDCRTQFVALFMKELHWLLGIETTSSTAYHPQMGEQTEWVNQELEQYIWVFVREQQDDWYSLLPLTEFSYNNHIHSSTQHTPFLLDTGCHPQMGFELHQPPSKVEAVNEFTDHMKDMLEEAKAALAKVKDDMTRYYNQWRTPALTYAPGNRVYLDASNVHMTWPSRKLSHCCLGPFLVERQVRMNAYRLILLPSMKRLHPVFNIVKLTSALPNPIAG